MPRAVIGLELTGDNLTLEEAEQLANYLRMAMKMAPMGSVRIEIGHVTYEGHQLTTEVSSEHS